MAMNVMQNNTNKGSLRGKFDCPSKASALFVHFPTQFAEGTCARTSGIGNEKMFEIGIFSAAPMR
jgi:hypothetical protein